MSVAAANQQQTLTAAETDRDALRARVAELEALLRDAIPDPFGTQFHKHPTEWYEKRRALLAPSSEPQP